MRENLLVTTSQETPYNTLLDNQLNEKPKMRDINSFQKKSAPMGNHEEKDATWISLSSHT